MMTKDISHIYGIAMLSVDLSAESGAPSRIKIMPSGHFQARDSRKWVLSDAKAVIEMSEKAAQGIDLVIDYNHQTDYAVKNGQIAPAAGWIKKLFAEEDGIYANVEWTQRAKEMIEAKEYRYISPTFMHKKENGEVTLIKRAALTNNPALAEQHGIALAGEDLTFLTKENSMDEKLKARLLKAVGLKPDAKDEEIVQLCEELAKSKAENQAGLEKLAKLAELDKFKNADDVETALAEKLKSGSEGEKQQPSEADPSKYVPMEAFAELQSQMKAMLEEVTTGKASAAVDSAIKSGKLMPSMREWGLKLHKQDEKAFCEFIAKAPALTERQMSDATLPDDTKSSRLSESEKAMCEMMGISEKDFIATKTGKEPEAAKQ